MRVDKMIQRGLIEEVEQLLEKGYGLELPSMSGIGYKQISHFLRGEMSLPDATDRMKHETHRLARHQYAWFRLSDSRIRWFNVSEPEEKAGIVALNEVKGLIRGFMS